MIDSCGWKLKSTKRYTLNYVGPPFPTSHHLFPSLSPSGATLSLPWGISFSILLGKHEQFELHGLIQSPLHKRKRFTCRATPSSRAFIPKSGPDLPWLRLHPFVWLPWPEQASAFASAVLWAYCKDWENVCESKFFYQYKRYRSHLNMPVLCTDPLR